MSASLLFRRELNLVRFGRVHLAECRRLAWWVCGGLGLGIVTWGQAQQIAHEPAEPKSGAAVTVTARGPFPAGVSALKVRLQAVDPGKYVRRTDPTYIQEWQELPMRDDGFEGDAQAGDGVHTVRVPGDWQRHRRLVRYVVAAAGDAAANTRWPVATQDCPNFAWFVYDGLPAWTGASRPGAAPALQFSSAFLGTLPTYHLLARGSDVRLSQWDPSADRQPFLGTLVYDGRVYDHIVFHNRGQGSTYVSGKNKWGFQFNPADEFRARDVWGRPYRFPWHRFSLNACASPWAQVNRGMAGMDEAVSYRAYQLAGVPSPNTHWIQFRVIDAAEESSTRSQYEGDLWGLYLVVQTKDERWLQELELPDGTIVSPESGLKHAGPGLPTDLSDWIEFSEKSKGRQSETWWRTHWSMPTYSSFHALNRVLANIDLRHGANHYVYRPRSGPWRVLPHDLDMMFIPKTHWPGIIDQTACLQVPALKVEFQNRARDVLDLFCADPDPHGGQVGQLVDEWRRVLCPAGQERTWPELDLAMWNWHPRNAEPGQFYRTPMQDHRFGGSWRRTLATPDFDGFCRYLVDFCTDSRPTKNYRPNDGDPRGYGFGFLAMEARDAAVPPRPEIGYVGATNHAPSALRFTLRSPRPAAGVTWQWRVGEIAAPGLAGYEPGKPCRYEIEPVWLSEDLAGHVVTLTLPPSVCRSGHTYRVRARQKDPSGRWSHWSAAVQFVAGPTTAATP